MQEEIKRTKRVLVSEEIIQEHEKRGTLVEIDESKAITWNEKRKKYGLDPIPCGDVVLISKYDNNQALKQKDRQPKSNYGGKMDIKEENAKKAAAKLRQLLQGNCNSEVRLEINYESVKSQEMGRKQVVSRNG